MPLVTNSGKVTIPFDAESSAMIRESQKVIDELERVKLMTQNNGRIIEQQVKREEEARKSATMSWTDFRSMYQTVLDVVRVGQQVWDEFGQKFVDNAVLVGNMARSLGTTTEEASRLKEVADDVGIGVDSLKTSMKLALKDGFEPNIDGLARMSDEYLKLAPGTERMQYLLDRFGKSGEDMGKILEKGGDSIKKMSAGMDEGLIVTEKSYQQARQYQVSVDALKDSWDALTYKAAPPLVDAVTNVTDAVRDSMRAQEILTEQGKKGTQVWEQAYTDAMNQAKAEREQADATLLAKDAATDASGAFETEAERTKRLTDESKAAEQAIKDLTKANQDELKTLGDMTKTIGDYKDKQSDLQAKHDELLYQKQIVLKGWSEESEKVQEVNAKLAENEAAMQENTEAFQLATNQRILARAEELLSIDGLTTEEKNGLIERGIAMGVYTQEAADRMHEEEKAADDLAAALSDIPKNVSTTVTTNYVSNYSTNYTPGQGLRTGNPNANQHAFGGVFEIPMSYGNEGFRMGNGDTASAGEKLAIAPKGKDIIDYKQLGKEVGRAVAYELRKGGG